MSIAAPRNLVLVIVLAALLYLLGNGAVSLWDRDEPRYAQTSRQMLQSGDWVVPRFLDKVRTAKPVFIYWCQAAAMAVIGDQGDAGVFAARLPSAVAMTIVLIIVGVVVRGAAGPERAFWTVFILASSVLTIWSAKTSLTDAVLLVGITVAQMCLYAIWRGRATWPVVIVLGVAVGQAGLTKGPVVLGVMGMTLAALGVFWLIDRRRGLAPSPGNPGEGRGEGASGGEMRTSPTARPHPSPLPEYRERGQVTAFGVMARIVVAIAIVAAIVGPWLYLVSQREKAFLGTSVSHDVLKRVAQPLEGHSGPPGYHLASVFGTFLPWSLLLPMAVVFAWKNRSDPQVRFALAAVIGPWVMFELVRTKLPHYMLPAFPPLAFLTADAIVRCLRGEKDDLRGRAVVVAWGVIAVLVIALGVGAIWAARHFGDSLLPPVVLTIVAMAFAVTVLSFFIRRQPRNALLAMGVGMAALYVALFGVYLPRADFLRVSTRTADVLRGAGAPGNVGASEMMDYKEPSLAFYEGGTIRENSAMTLSHEIMDAGPSCWVITDDVWRKTPNDVRIRLEPVGSVSGLAYADGRVVEVMVVRKRQMPSTAPANP